MGPPELLGYPGKGCFRLAISADGRRLAVSDYDLDQAFVLNTERPAGRVATGNCPHTHRLALSADGRYLATRLHGDAGEIKVWDTGTGRLVKTLPNDGGFVVSGGCRLAVGGSGLEPPGCGSSRPGSRARRWPRTAGALGRASRLQPRRPLARRYPLAPARATLRPDDRPAAGDADGPRLTIHLLARLQPGRQLPGGGDGEPLHRPLGPARPAPAIAAAGAGVGAGPRSRASTPATTGCNWP